MCLGTTHDEQRVTHCQPWGKQMTLLENVPAQVCTQCGEIVFSGKVAKRIAQIAQIARSGAKPKRMEQMPVYDFADEEPAGVEAGVEEIPA